MTKFWLRRDLPLTNVEFEEAIPNLKLLKEGLLYECNHTPSDIFEATLISFGFNSYSIEDDFYDAEEKNEVASYTTKYFQLVGKH